MESLEGRRLLAADTGVYPVPFPYQNDLIPEDVSGDYDVSAIDALLVINAINNDVALSEVEPGRKADGPMYDVSGDNQLSPLDALMVRNFLNGEGETTPTAVFTYEFIDSTGAPLSGNQVTVGDIFQLQTFIRDTRGFSAAGINAAYLDIAFDNDTSFDVAVGEIQTLKFFVNQLDTSDTSSSFTLGFDGQTTAPIALFANGSPRSDTAIAESIETALADLSNVGAGNVTAIVDSAAKSEDQQNNVPRFNFEIRFANQLAGQDLPEITLDDSNVAVTPGGTFEFAIATVLNGDESNPEAEANAFVFSDLYDFARRSDVQPGEFNDIGAASQQIPLPGPAESKLLFTVPLVARSPGVINFTPNEADNPPSTDIITGTTVIPTSMVDFGDAFSITVVSDPTAPIAVNDTLTINEDSSVTLGTNVLANDTVTAPRTLSVLSAATTGTTVGTLNGLTYSPPADFSGTDVITYIAQDSTGLQSNIGTVTINVTAVNDDPVANDDTATVDEDSVNNPLDVLSNDNGGPNESTDTLTITAVGATSNGGTVNIVNGTSLTYTPVAGFIGTDVFTYTIEDQGGLTDTATVTITVEPAVLPRGRADAATTDENNAVEIDVLNNDRVNDNSNATLISVTNGAFGTVTINDGGTPNDATDDTVTYTPDDENFNGTDTFTYVMNDTSGLGADSTGTVTVTVNNINDAPVLADDTATTEEDTPLTIAAATLLSNDSPGPGEDASSQNPQTLTITAVGNASSGSVALDGTNVVYTPAADFNGTATFTYDATDNGTPALTSTATVTITVTAVNDAPIAGDDTASTDEDTSLQISTDTLLANDSSGPSDESGQTLTITAVSGSSANGGTASLAGTTVTYTPAADFNGTDTITYTLSDGQATSTGTLTINVAPINDAPVPGADSLAGFNQQSLIINVSDLLANDTPGPANESSQTLSITAVAATSDTNGTVVLNSDGTITYTPNTDFVGTATFTYTVEDDGPTGGSNVNSATGTVTLDIQAFTPSTIGGTVWVDETGDGIIDASERQLGAVEISISGTSLGQSVSETVMTLSDGSYSFDELGPGTYTISFAQPTYFLDGVDVPGSLGDQDTVENQFTVTVTEPGGVSDNNYNFALLGLDPMHARKIDQLASRYMIMNPSLAYNGAYFAVGADNSLLWSAKLDGFDSAVFTEAVMTNGGSGVLLTYVDEAGNIFTASLGRGDFVKTTNQDGNSIIRVLGSSDDFDWQQVSRATPPFSAQNYLTSIDEIFAQEGW